MIIVFESNEINEVKIKNHLATAVKSQLNRGRVYSRRNEKDKLRTWALTLSHRITDTSWGDQETAASVDDHQAAGNSNGKNAQKRCTSRERGSTLAIN